MLLDKILEWLVPIGTLVSSGFAGWAAYAASRAATATAIQADASRKQLISEQRAWVAFEFALRSELEFHEHGADIAVSVVNTNIGKTPALEVHTTIKAIVHSGGPGRENVDSIFRRMTKEYRKSVPEWGKLLLPGSSYERKWNVRIENSDLHKYKYLPLFIAVCVTYKILHDDELHQTAVLYGVEFSSSETANFESMRDNHLIIPLHKISVGEWSGGFAD